MNILKTTMVLSITLLFYTLYSDTVYGKVTDAKKYPLPGTKVKVGNFETTADSLGEFRLEYTSIASHYYLTKQAIRMKGNILSVRSKKTKQHVQLLVYNLRGQQLLYMANVTNSSNKTEFNLGSLFPSSTKNGIYIFKISIDQQEILLRYNSLLMILYKITGTEYQMEITERAPESFLRALFIKPGYQTTAKEIPAHGNIGNIVLIPNLMTDTLDAPFDVASFYGPSGWAGDWQNITLNDANRTYLRPEDPDQKNTKWIYRPQTNVENWAGAEYQHPDNNWGDTTNGAPGLVITNAKKLTFYSRGEAGGEKVHFTAGGKVYPEFPYNNSFLIDTLITLSGDWKKYEIDLSSEDLSSVLWGFGWKVNRDEVSGIETVFYIDEMRYD